MPLPYQRMHGMFLSEFFIQGKPTSKLSDSLLFAQTSNEYIVAVSVNPKINYMLNDRQE